MKYLKQSGKVIAMALAVLMLLTMVACTSRTENETVTTAVESSTAAVTTAVENVKEPITLTVLWGDEGMKGQGIMDDPVAQEIKKQTGVTLDIDVANADKVKTKFASNDLADIVMINNADMRDQLYEGKLALNMEPLLETNGQNILKTAPDRINIARYQAELRGMKGIYALSGIAGTRDAKGGIDYNPLVGMYTRWDYYKELGYPEIKSVDDYINLLAEMAKKHPTTKDGKKVYALSGWMDWGLWPFIVQPVYDSGSKQTGNEVYITFVKGEKPKSGLIQENGLYWQGIEMFYKANKLGLLDTDIFTMKYDAFMAKAKAGQVLNLFANWQANEANAAFTANGQTGEGFEPIPGVYGATSVYPQVYAAGAGAGISISASSKNPDRAIDLLNYCFSYEGSRTLTSGVKGVHWDIVNGKAEPTDSVITQKKSDPEFSKVTGIGQYWAFVGLDHWTIDPTDNSPVSIISNSTKAMKTLLTDIDRDFCSHYGNAEYPGQVFDNLVKAGKLLGGPYVSFQSPLMANPSDEMNKSVDNAKEYLLANIAKIVLSKTDEEFAAEKKKAIDKFKELGVDKYEEWFVNEWDVAGQKAAELSK